MPELRFSTKYVDTLVIGSGISGLFTALKLSSQGVRVFLITKSALDDSNSRYAQGGIAAVLPNNPDDSLELHLRDTIKAGAGLCNETMSRSILSEGFPAIEDLLHFGVPFDRKPNHDLALTREAAHSVARILHAGGDATGHSVEMTLIEKAKADPLIEVLEYGLVVELLTDGKRCYGCRAVSYANHAEHEEVLILSPHTVLATGGVGRLYSHSTNPAIATGDGIALAYQAGASIENMEFIQFHPTAFYAEGRLHFLVSEALRGEGGILRNQQGERFAFHYHPDGELAPRDIVTRAIYDEMQQAGLPYVYLDITHLPKETIELRFPTILDSCLRFGVDIRKDWIPVAPAAHYLMGGVTVDIDGKSTLPGLYSVGETAYTGLHGANRLASNSLLECVVLARRVASYIAAHNHDMQPALSAPTNLDLNPRIYEFHHYDEIESQLDTLHKLMWDNVGIIRTESHLTAALEQIILMREQAEQAPWRNQVPLGIELRTQLLVAGLITEAALARKESRGAHFREDFPESKPQLAYSTAASHRKPSLRP